MKTPLRNTQLLPGNLQNLFYPPSKYEYFSRAQALPFPTSDIYAKAAWAADAAMLAYARYGTTRMTDSELEANFTRGGLTCRKVGRTPEDWNAPGTQAVVATCPDFALCAFRGTERDDPKDLLSDLDVVLVYERDHRIAPQGEVLSLWHLNLVLHLVSEPCLVHQGFQLALNEVWPQILQAVTAYRQQHPASEICFTGHSLGAALAVLAFSRFADPDMSLYTFGCPRVGDGAFRNRVLSNQGKGIYRFVNYNDAITHVPTDSLLYRQIPDTSYRFDANGDLGSDDGCFKGDLNSLRAAILTLSRSVGIEDLEHTPAPDSLVDHSPARYCFRLWDLV